MTLSGPGYFPSDRFLLLFLSCYLPLFGLLWVLLALLGDLGEFRNPFTSFRFSKLGEYKF